MAKSNKKLNIKFGGTAMVALTLAIILLLSVTVTVAWFINYQINQLGGSTITVSGSRVLQFAIIDENDVDNTVCRTSRATVLNFGFPLCNKATLPPLPTKTASGKRLLQQTALPPGTTFIYVSNSFRKIQWTFTWEGKVPFFLQRKQTPATTEIFLATTLLRQVAYPF